MVPSVDSYEPSVSCSVMNIESTTRKESSTAPRLRLLAQDEVLERAGAERGEAAVDALGIGLGDAAVARRQQVDGALRFRPKAMHADFVIEREGAGPMSAASSPAARRRARSIWKKRSCACRKPSGTSDVLARGAADRGDAEPIAFDSHGRRESRRAAACHRVAAGWREGGCVPRMRPRRRRPG